MHKIPKQNRDLSRYVLKKDLLRLLGLATWLVFWLGGALLYNHNHRTYRPDQRMVGWRLGLWIGIAFVTGFFRFRVSKSLFDRSFLGTITANQNSRGYTPSQDPGKNAVGSYDFRVHTSLRVKGPKGGRHRIRFEQKDGFYNYYHEGNEILHLRGLPYPINLDPDRKCGTVCSACGTWYKDKVTHCDICRHTVIDPAALAAADSERNKEQP